jgi:hypothetical protein
MDELLKHHAKWRKPEADHILSNSLDVKGIGKATERLVVAWGRKWEYNDYKWAHGFCFKEKTNVPIKHQHIIFPPRRESRMRHYQVRVGDSCFLVPAAKGLSGEELGERREELTSWGWGELPRERHSCYWGCEAFIRPPGWWWGAGAFGAMGQWGIFP